MCNSFAYVVEAAYAPYEPTAVQGVCNLCTPPRAENVQVIVNTACMYIFIYCKIPAPSLGDGKKIS